MKKLENLYKSREFYIFTLGVFEKCSKFDARSFEAKNRVFEFDYQKMNTFKSVRCSNTFDDLFSKSSEGLFGLSSMFDVHSF